MDNGQGIALHQLIMAGDDLALAKLYDQYGESIIFSLRSWYPKVAQKDLAHILEAVNEAFWGYFKNPGTFEPHKGTLKRFLEVAAERDLINLLQKENRHNGKIALPEDVELEEKLWNSITEDTQPADEGLIRQEIMELIDNELNNYFPTASDTLVAKMILQGVRETVAFAEVLQIGELGPEEQRKEVKKIKDRIIKVIERNQIVSKLKNLLK